MKLATIRGQVTHPSFAVELLPYRASYGIAGPGTAHTVTLRVNDVPTSLRVDALPSIAEGDEVVAVGKFRDGTFVAAALGNLTTGAKYIPSSTPSVVAAAVFMGIGLLALFGSFGLPSFMGVVLIGFGALAALFACRMVHAGFELDRVMRPGKTYFDIPGNG